MRLALMVFSAVLCFAQMRPTGELEITVKIVLEDGSPLTSSPIIQLLVPGSRQICSAQESFGNGLVRLKVPFRMIQDQVQSGCEIAVIVDGFRPFSGYVKEGTVITMHRNGVGEDAGVSLISLKAPTDAKKQYDEGEKQMRREKWAPAELHFRTAVSLYPQFSAAWCELGQVLVRLNRYDDAAVAFNKARVIEPQYVRPLALLASLGSIQEHWDDEMKFSEDALKMRPIGFPEVYFYHAEATFHLGKLDDAERLTREAIQLDPGATCPESLVLLGAIFEKQGNPQDASIEYKNYLQLAPHGLKAADARNSLARFKN